MTTASPPSTFADALKTLYADILAWADLADWATRTYPKALRLGGERADVPALLLQRGPDRLLLDPVGDDFEWADGVVDLYVMPAYENGTFLSLKGGAWSVEGEAVGGDAVPLSRESLLAALDRLIAADRAAV